MPLATAASADAPVVRQQSIAAVAAHGWNGLHTDVGNFSAGGDSLTVRSAGHNADGDNATITRALGLTTRVRQPYPNQANLTADTVALADFVYAGDTIQGVANNSTRAAPKPVCLWLQEDNRRLSGQQDQPAVAVAHWHARQGRPVAAVEFVWTDGTGTVSSGKITAMTTRSYTASGLHVPCFEPAAPVDLSALADDTLLTLHLRIYPWVGPMWTTETAGHFAVWPSINFCEQKVFNAVAQTPIYAYVDGVGGGTPQASTVQVTAQANPYATITAAAQAIVALDGADASRGEVVVPSGTTEFSGVGRIAVGDTPLIIRGVNSGSRLTTILRNTADGFAGTSDKLKLQHLTIQQNNSGDVFFDNAAGANSENTIVTENCYFDSDVPGAYSGLYFYRVGRWWAIDCTGDGVAGLAQQFSVQPKMVNVIGCQGLGLSKAGTVYNCVGTQENTNARFEHVSGSLRDVLSGGMIGWNVLRAGSVAAGIINLNLDIDDNGLAVVGNVLERTAASPAGNLGINSIGTANPCDNVIVQGNTSVGNRTNVLYQDSGSTNIEKIGSFRFNVLDEYNCKSDVFGTNGNLTGNWSMIYKVGHALNAYTYGSNGDDVPGVGSWLGEILAEGEVAGSDATPLAVNFTDDQSVNGGGAGGGDYAPASGSVIPTYGDAALLPYGTDLNGTALTAASHIGAVG